MFAGIARFRDGRVNGRQCCPGVAQRRVQPGFFAQILSPPMRRPEAVEFDQADLHPLHRLGLPIEVAQADRPVHLGDGVPQSVTMFRTDAHGFIHQRQGLAKISQLQLVVKLE